MFGLWSFLFFLLFFPCRVFFLYLLAYNVCLSNYLFWNPNIVYFDCLMILSMLYSYSYVSLLNAVLPHEFVPKCFPKLFSLVFEELCICSHMLPMGSTLMASKWPVTKQSTPLPPPPSSASLSITTNKTSAPFEKKLEHPFPTFFRANIINSKILVQATFI